MSLGFSIILTGVWPYLDKVCVQCIYILLFIEIATIMLLYIIGVAISMGTGVYVQDILIKNYKKLHAIYILIYVCILVGPYGRKRIYGLRSGG